METNKALNILVGLDLSEMDHYLIQYAKILDHILNVEQITFIHNLKLGELPKELIQKDQLALIQKRITKRVEEQISATEITYKYEIIITVENYSEIAFASISKQKNYDLLVLGNKQQLTGNGALANKLVRLLPSATLLVPETFHIPIETVIDAIDFSRYTNAIMLWADRFKNNSKGQRIKHSAVHISKSYWSYLPMMTDKELDKISLEDIKEKEGKWNKQYAQYTDIDIVPAKNQNVAAALIQYAKTKKADLMILGVKGSAGIKDIILGSVANHVLHRPTDTCLLFVKPLR
ncbi:nucleotide-binding universal stress UspA family protein [Myroides gitamensis]|uniref:Universal stress protein family n=1 Tax=Myroides odoratus TaxID=256 RepID=A0A378U6B4_MYROD|nr:universal stress protein [Myroides odoratus]MCS4237407.1 nucleotide-binding universal stress UspA family protein [Myroides odoratus]MDH6601862.1 nucleotide-binding universal stress UspA family protein [Myroides gitamensis]QQU03056.1 universal stress protein [Myroides odoratus]STZ69703.1 Universal stress protein family [Myroides odoratus]